MKIAVVGAGAVGCYYGGKLAAVGEDVHFLMRSDLKKVQRSGLRIRSGGEELHLDPVHAAGSTEEIGPVDLVMIALKATSNDALPQLLPPLLKEDTAVMTLQNGLGNEEELARLAGAARVMGALCFVCLNRVESGVIEHYGHGTISIGEHARPPQPRTHAIAAALRSAGIEARVVEDLALERWRKLVWNIPFNGLSIAANEATVADVLADEGLHALAEELMRETIAAAAALGHRIPDDFVKEQIDRSYPMGPYKPSSMIDFQLQRAVEVEAIWGEPLRQARQAGLETPRLEMLYHLLRQWAP